MPNPADLPAFHKSMLDHVDEALRLLAALFLGFCVAFMQNMTASVAGLFVGLALVSLARPGLSLFLRRLAAVNVFIAFIWLVVPFTYGGFGPSREGVELSLLVSVRANSIFCIFMGLVAPLRPTSLGCALKKLHCPEKLVLLLLLAGRGFYLLGSQWRDLVQAAKLRGFAPGFNAHSYRTLGSLLGLLLVKSGERAERMREAMLLRGFDGKLRLCCAWHLDLADYLFAAASAASLFILCFMEWFCHA